MVPLEYVIYVLYLLLGPITWIFFGVALFAGRRRMSLIERSDQPVPEPQPLVTIVIPAKNEGERIADCLRSALAQDYGNFEVLAIDDRSTDQTGAVMDELARSNPRLHVVHNDQGPPPGWTGKCNALHRAAPLARGQWLLFVDSDVILQPQALRETLRLAAGKGHGMVSLFLKLEAHSFWEDLLMPLAVGAVGGLWTVALSNNDHHKHIGFANGQYILIRRDVYEAIGGHEAVRDRFTEDVEMARIVKARGYRPRVAWGTDLAAVRMYSSLAGVIRGWARNFYGIGLGSPWRILLGMAFVLYCCLSVFPVIPWAIYRQHVPINVFGGWGWGGTAIAHVILMVIFLGFLYSSSGNRRRNALLFPLGLVMLLVIFVAALRHCITGRLQWRGDVYGGKPAPAAKPAAEERDAAAARS